MYSEVILFFNHSFIVSMVLVSESICVLIEPDFIYNAIPPMKNNANTAIITIWLNSAETMLNIPDILSTQNTIPTIPTCLLYTSVISYEHVIKQAAEYGHTVKRELSFLILHSILHLFGYDHINDEDRHVMEAVQRDILDEMGITR